ncbi:MAG TPA: PilZ domain-containing protein [Pyrinomonadaceae bacterium]|nr:PilZ domain-containing protein [Pyrinomonadaceae bacterium]
MLRELASKFSITWTERRASKRKEFHVPVKVSFAPLDKNPLNLTARHDDSFLSGETVDLSDTGLAFIVSSIRIKEKYLVGQERVLKVELDLAGKKVHMRIMGVRYERVGIHSSSERYLVGGTIVEMSDDDRQKYEFFLKNGKKLLKASTVPAFNMGVID